MRQVANFLQKFPWIAHTAIRIWQLGRPRFTAGVMGIVINDANEILLVEHVFHPTQPWGLPGGWVDRKESFEHCVKRELLEELELNVSIEQLLDIHNSPFNPHHIDIFYLCTPNNDVGKLSNELLNYRWSAFNDLPTIRHTQLNAIKKALQSKPTDQQLRN